MLDLKLKLSRSRSRSRSSGSGSGSGSGGGSSSSSSSSSSPIEDKNQNHSFKWLRSCFFFEKQKQGCEKSLSMNKNNNPTTTRASRPYGYWHSRPTSAHHVPERFDSSNQCELSRDSQEQQKKQADRNKHERHVGTIVAQTRERCFSRSSEGFLTRSRLRPRRRC